MADRIRYNFDLIRSYRKSPEALRLVESAAERMAERARVQGSEVQTDSEIGSTRARAAVIAGYESGATAENTRRVLLASLDGE